MNEKQTIEFSVPEERIGVFIGKKGRTKKLLEEILGISIEIDTQNNQVIFYMNEKNPLKELKIKEIVDAISHGFSPDIAINLLDDSYSIYKIDLKDIFGKNKKTIERYESRIIGTKGTIKKKIEELTNTYISVYDHYIYILGKLNDVMIAKEGIYMILDGARHSSVISFLERKVMEKNLLLK